MKHNDVKMVDGSMEGLFIPSEAGSAVPGALHVDGRFLVYRDSQGEQSIEIMDGNDYVEWISYLGRAQSNNRILNAVNNAAAATAVGSVGPKINPYYAVSSNTQQMAQYANLNTNITTGDFTFEAWRRVNTLGGDQSYPHDIFNSAAPGLFRFGWRTVGRWWLKYGSEDIQSALDLEPEVDTWHHVAVEREGRNIRMYVGGKLILEVDRAIVNISLSQCTFGSQYGNYMPTCHLDEIILTRVPKYKGENFVPKNKPIVLP